MLLWDQPLAVEGYTAYRDSLKSNLFYVMPRQPSFRVEAGRPVFNFTMYRKSIERADGSLGGGFLIADVQCAVPDEDHPKILGALQELLDQRFGSSTAAPRAEIGQLAFTRGTSSIQILDSGGKMVQSVRSPGAPALYGKMITPFTAELSPEGAALLEASLQGQGGVVQVVYDVWLPVALPPVEATVWFEASKFMEFHQQVDIDWNCWGQDEYRESISEQFRSSDAGGVEINPGSVTDQKVLGAVRDWAWTSLEEAVQRMALTDIEPVSKDDRKIPDGIDNAWRDISVSKMASFRRTYREGQVMEWNPQPRGTLPNITTLLGPDGQPLAWKDFSQIVDLDHPLFRTLKADVRANAPFGELPIDSVEVKLQYDSGSVHRVQEFSLRSPDDVGHFETFIENDVYDYRYSYQVNYEGESRRFDAAPETTNEKVLTVNVGDLGVFDLQLEAADLDFTQVAQAKVTVQYEDPAGGVPPLEHAVMLTKDHPTARVQQVIFAPVTQPHRHQVKYTMANGKEFVGDWTTSRSQRLFIGDPFRATRVISLRAFGDLNTRIDTIFMDVSYADEANGYTQTKSFALNKTAPFVDWAIPVIDEKAGEVSYTGTIRFANGTIEAIPREVATGNTILVGDVPRAIDVLPDLVDWTKAKLVKVSLHYVDDAHTIDESRDIVFKSGQPQAVWTHAFKDKTKPLYDYRVTYFLTSGGTKSLESTSSELSLVVPEVPA